MTPQKLSIVTLVTVLAISGLANAQTCASNSDCAPGLTCQVGQATMTPVPACPAGTDCPALPPSTPSMTCLPAPCQTDSDCGQGLLCHGTTTTTCSGGTAVAVKCDPSTICTTPTEPPTNPVCTDTTTYQCIYRWQLPCNLDADCGDGFVCQPTTMGTCSGSSSTGGGSATSSPGAGGGSGTGELSAPPPLPVSDGGATTTPVCTTTTSYPGSCQAKVATCTADSDCPSILKCVGVNVPTAVSSGPNAVDAGAALTQSPPPTTTTSTATAAKTCQPPSSYPGRTEGVGTDQPTVALNATPDGGATTKGTTTPPTTVQQSGGPSTDTKTTATVTSSGCALGAGTQPGLPASLLLGALGLLRLRRGRKG